ncbi:MAG: ice-binding family protein [Gallionellaceae bacterium]|jgi:hypothetical protein
MSQFKKFTHPLRWFVALLIVVLAAGCGDSGTPDNTAPTVGSVVTENVSLGVLDKTVTANFTETMDPASLTDQTFTVKKQGDTANIPGVVSYSGNTAIFTPNSVLEANTTYTATLTTDIKDLAGNALATNHVWSFMTGSLESIAVTPASASIALGGTKQFSVTATYTDQTTSDVTAIAIWTAATSNVASVSTAGVASSIGVGTVLITATFGNQIASTSLAVTSATLTSLALTPAAPSIALGTTQQMIATATYSDLTTADVSANLATQWTSASIGVASVSTLGVATPVATGSSVITASFGGISATATLTVTAATISSISIAPVAPSIAQSAAPLQFVATASYSDGTTAVVDATWVSADPAVATIVGSTGVATPIAGGASLITATFSGYSATTTLTVNSATLSSIAVTPTASSIASAGSTQQFVATATFSDSTTAVVPATWTSASDAVATISIGGLATSVASGTSLITASFGGQSNTANLTVTAATLSSIAVTPTPKTIALGSNQQFVATATYSDATTSVVSANWVSGSPAVATVSLSGLATPVAKGSSLITANFGGQAATANLTVIDANPTAPKLGEAGRFVLLASQAITTTGTTAISNGDMAIEDQARSYFAGFTTGPSAGQFTQLTNGLSYAVNDANPAPYAYPLHTATVVVGAPWTTTAAMITQAKTDLGIAYSFLAADPNPGAPTQVCPTELGTLTLTRGVYKTASNVGISTGALHLDAQGDPNAVFIFSIDGTLTTGASGSIILDNGALAKNVFWRSGGKTTIAAGTTFMGNVFSWTQINVLAGANITGSLFAVTNQITLISDTITKAP